MTALSKIGSLLRKVRPRSNHVTAIQRVPERFINVFASHGIEAGQIPRVLPALSLGVLGESAALLDALTPQIIDKTAELFGVRREWLEGSDNEIYEYLGTYQEPKVILDHIAALHSQYGDSLNFPFRVLVADKALDRRASRIQYLIPVLVEPVLELGNKKIYRYHVYRDGMRWNEFSCRIELKAIARLVFCNLRFPVPMYRVSIEEIEQLLEGKVVPMGLLRGALVTEPSLEDFAISDSESMKAKETDELPEVLRYIQEHRLDSYFLNNCEDGAVTPSDALHGAASVIREATPKARQPRASTIARWEPVRNAAQGFWSNAPDLEIEEVIRRLKQVPSFKVTALDNSTIRKHIVDLAPPAVRKPGRKAKKSSNLLASLVAQKPGE